MKRARLAAVASTVAVGILFASGCSAAGSSKAGGDAAPVTLRIGTDDEPGRPAADAIEEFARQVEAISDGQLLIEPVWQAVGPEQDDWDQAVARLIVDGDLDMGMIPARAWDTEGVSSLRALQAPFLVTSEELVEQVVTADIAEEMLSGLDEIGITGLALVPEGLRQVFSFGAPLLTPSDFEGVTVRAPTSNTTYALFEALGATVDDLPGELFPVGVEAGTVAAAESSFAFAARLPRTTTATGNLITFPKVNSLVINEESFAGLSEAQQQVLRDAATMTRDWGVRSMIPLADGAEQYCAEGGTVVTTTEENLAAFRSAAQPVYDELERDAATKALIEEIRHLASQTDAPEPVAACGSATEAAPTPQPSTVTFPDGVYRMQISEQDFLDAGVDQQSAGNNAGIWTLTFQTGSLTIAQQGHPDDPGVYCTAAGRVTLVIDTDRCGDDSGLALFSAEWSLEDEQLVFSAIRSEDEGPLFQVFHETLWGSHPWEKIG